MNYLPHCHRMVAKADVPDRLTKQLSTIRDGLHTP